MDKVKEQDDGRANSVSKALLNQNPLHVPYTPVLGSNPHLCQPLTYKGVIKHTWGTPLDRKQEVKHKQNFKVKQETLNDPNRQPFETGRP